MLRRVLLHSVHFPTSKLSNRSGRFQTAKVSKVTPPLNTALGYVSVATNSSTISNDCTSSNRLGKFRSSSVKVTSSSRKVVPITQSDWNYFPTDEDLAAGEKADVIVILAGGMLPDGGLPEWVVRRCEAAAVLSKKFDVPVLCCGGGTPHKPPIICPSGQVLHESTALAEWMLERGLEPNRLYKEWASFDTIGNGYYTLTSHVIPRNWSNVLVLTSDFHLPRSRAIFEWMFGSAQEAGVFQNGKSQNGDQCYNLSFVAVDDEGIDEEAIESRHEREAESLKNLKVTASEHPTLAAIHEWFHSEHRCYAVARQDEMMYPQDAEKYGLDAKSLRSY